MLRLIATTIACTVLLNGSPASAAHRDEHLEFWAEFVGDWQLENQSLELTVTHTKSGACFIFETAPITFVHGWDPAEQKMKTLSFYDNGAHGVGHATIVNGDMVGQSRTVSPDGSSRNATWRITRRSDTQFVFTTGDASFVFNRTN